MKDTHSKPATNVDRLKAELEALASRLEAEAAELNKKYQKEARADNTWDSQESYGEMRAKTHAVRELRSILKWS